MKRNALCLWVFFLLLGLAIPCLADCGKIIIIPRPPIRPCPPRVTVTRIVTVTEVTTIDYMVGGHYGRHDHFPYRDYVRPVDQRRDEIYRGGEDWSRVGIDETGKQERPDPYQGKDPGALDTVYGSKGIFTETEQQGVIAWNGTKEILVLSTNEASTLGQGAAMLSVMPLPGKPLNIQRANKEIFVNAKKLLAKKYQEDGDQTFGVILKTQIGAHNIFAWEVDNIEQFEDQVNSYIAETYGKEYSALFNEATKRVVQDYLKRGFKYFAFDLTLVDKHKSTKEAIAYTFECRSVFFPTVISGLGGKGKTKIDLTVFTAGGLNDFSKGLSPASAKDVADGNMKDYEVYIPHGKSVACTDAEIRALDPIVADLFGGKGAQGRTFLVTGELDKFEKDIVVRFTEKK